MRLSRLMLAALLVSVAVVGCGPPEQNTAGQPSAPDPNADPRNKRLAPPKGAGEMPGNLTPPK